MNSEVSRFYVRNLNAHLRELIEGYLRGGEEYSLSEELAFARVAAKDVIEQYNECDSIPDAKQKKELKQLAALQMMATLKDVSSICEKAAKVRLANKTDGGNVGQIVTAITQIVYELFGDDLVRAKKFDELVRNRIVTNLVPTAKGTTLLPSAERDVLAMDETIPYFGSNNYNGNGNGKH